jgi:hypothetical protein
MILSGIVIALVLIRGMTNPKLTARLTDQVAMKEAMLHAVPSGSTIVFAEQFMTREGFQCLRTTNADFAEQDRVYHQIDYVSCDRTDSAGFPVTRRWQIALVYENEHISDVLVSTGLIGP